MSHPQWQQPEQPRPISWPGEPAPYPSQSWPAAQDPYTPTGGQPVPYPQSGPAYGQQQYPAPTYGQPVYPQQPYQQQGPYGPPPGYPPQYQQPQNMAVAAPVMQQRVVIAGGRGVNHMLHLVLTICTGGVWGIVWIAVVIFQRRPKY